jgi:hypothetical protein
MVAILRSEVRQARDGLGAAARPWQRTGSVDVEALAVWAYGVQMVDRFEMAGMHAIELEVMGYESGGIGACGVGKLMQIGHLGCRVDVGSVGVRDTVHAAAYALASELSAVEHGAMVRQYALLGGRPDAWLEPEHKARASVWVKQWVEAQVEYQGPGRKGGYCPVIITWDKERVDWGRAQYAHWWQGLDDLAKALATRALGFSVTGPSAPREPWSVPTLFERGSQEAPPNGSSQRPKV